MSCEVKVKYLNLSLVTVTNKSSLDTICINTSSLKFTLYYHYDPNSSHHHLSFDHPSTPMRTDCWDILKREK